MDPSEHERARRRDAHLSGSTKGGSRGRADIAASWRRVSAAGVDPGGRPRVAPLDESEVQRRRGRDGLDRITAELTPHLQSVVDSGHLIVVADADGHVLWRLGRPGVRGLADELGFVAGSEWTEGNVGTNAIGTALVLGEPVHIQGAEHFVEAHARWGCSAAPLRDPWTGRVVGVVDISGPRTAMHPSLLATASMAARLASMELLERHRRALEDLRTGSGHLLTRVSGPAAVVDRTGHVAATSGLLTQRQVCLPDGMQPGVAHLPGVGEVIVEPLPGGWLLRGSSAEGPLGTRAVLDFTGEPRIQVIAESGPWTRRLTPRHAELLLALVGAGDVGLSAAALAEEVFADPSRVITVRAELSRLRRVVGGLLLTRPYRVAPTVDVEIRWPAAGGQLLPGASAPVVVRARAALAPSGEGRPAGGLRPRRRGRA
ncbi:MAG: GAF domain-containing protein [Janibacter sp.]|uniref:GAF domain-containing protein n=1 Tax=Janibacter limosus TaxID=53458 RepID=A0A4V0ZAL6_9MICO|nr:GAF domain-containing protein [Janibacter limosus]MDN5716551.1 GAF domain-containing protein [Janibacter sp.]QBF44928.1 GAF domain-containing protein [Janibacter limosus]